MKQLLAVALIAAACGAGGTDRVLVGAGTTLVDSGFIEALTIEYERSSGVELSVLAESSQRLLDLGRRGEVDLLLTHDRVGLDAFIADGYSTASADVLASTFLLAGPPELVSTLGGREASSVFAEIAERGLSFVSRADGSGTYRQELSFWAMAGVAPVAQAWYDTTGQGMGLTMQVAAQRSAFVVVEEGAWLDAATDLNLDIAPLANEWPNVYAATVAQGASRKTGSFYRWLLSADGAAAVTAVNERLFGTTVYRHIAE